MGNQEENAESKFQVYIFVVGLKVISFVVFWLLNIAFYVLLFFAVFAAFITWSYPRSQDWRVYAVIASPFPLAVAVWWVSGWYHVIMALPLPGSPPGPMSDQKGT